MAFLRFERMIYPVWRRQVPAMIKPFMDTAFGKFFPVYADKRPPRDASEMARFLVDWDLIVDSDLVSLRDAISQVEMSIDVVASDGEPRLHDGSPLRMPAQWEQTERVLVSWGRMYPTLWNMHAEMIEAISHVATTEILAPSELWARAIAVYLASRGKAHMDNVCFLVLRTDDIWIRDYGPMIGISETGERVAVNATYDVLPQYPQADDDGMGRRWAAHHDLAVQPLHLHTEGGNLWSDGAGTLLMSSQILYSNRYYTRDRMLDYLHGIFDFQKAIITPRLTLEETGHVDLLVKLARADTVLVSKAESPSTAEVMRKAKRLFERETNAQGVPYRVLELPTPSLYLNWIMYTIRRAYTNSLTVNGRVLVPVFDIPEDDIALRTYETALPDYEIVPIASRVGINGGGAVHCMTKEVPMV
ncbi:MAG: agmatine deiminase family protein [Chloroflexota bacterium]